jgi:hypothetical protein
MPNKKFHISDVLSISTGALVSTRRMDGIYDIMGHIVGNEVSTIGIAANAEAARKFLEQEMPWVKDVKFPKLPEEMSSKEREDFVDLFVRQAAAKYGEYHEVGQMTQQPDVGLAADRRYIAKVKRSGPGGTHGL